MNSLKYNIFFAFYFIFFTNLPTERNSFEWQIIREMILNYPHSLLTIAAAITSGIYSKKISTLRARLKNTKILASKSNLQKNLQRNLNKRNACALLTFLIASVAYDIEHSQNRSNQ